ncbi:MAG: hypothetical protein C0475_02210 [Planctomyces sp.]|nr:hypothetical protein [Planctomyces sp.]MBA4119824.1 hypothetical protein [Isosphaera sp.]
MATPAPLSRRSGPWQRRLALGPALLAAALPTGCLDSAPEADLPAPVPGVRIIGAPGTEPGLFVTPRAIAADAHTLWVVDRSGRVQRLDPRTGRCIEFFWLTRSQRGYPTGLAVGPDAEGNPCLYLADTHEHRVLVYRVTPVDPAIIGRTDLRPAWEPTTPEPARVVGGFGTAPGQFTYPCDVAVLADHAGRAERFYVSEFGGQDRVTVFDASWAPVRVIGGPGRPEDPDQPRFTRPQSLAIDPAARELLLCDSINSRVGRLSLEGELIAWVTPRPGPEPEQAPLSHPRGIHAPGDGTALLAEFGGSRLRRLDLASGRVLGAWGAPGRQPGALAEPWDLAVLDGTVYVTEGRNGRISASGDPGLWRPRR